MYGWCGLWGLEIEIGTPSHHPVIRWRFRGAVLDSQTPSHSSSLLPLSDPRYQVLEDLRPLHEEWAGGIALRGTSAYGVRLYQNGSTIVMHNDKVCPPVVLLNVWLRSCAPIWRFSVFV